MFPFRYVPPQLPPDYSVSQYAGQKPWSLYTFTAQGIIGTLALTQRQAAYQRWWRRHGPGSRRRWLENYKKTLSCSRCPESHHAALDFHHLDPSQKESAITRLVRLEAAEDVILAEIAKCIVLCANCHRKQHWMESLIQQTRDEVYWKQELQHKTPSYKSQSERMKEKWTDPTFREMHRQRILRVNAERKKKNQ